MAEQDRSKALKIAMSQIEKEHGKGSIMRLGEKPDLQMNVISTGSIGLDNALGIGGVPRGRVVEIYGQESSGKTTLALHIIAECQKAGGTAAFIDAEHALDPIYAKALGVDTEALLISQPSFGEEALNIAEILVRSGAVDVIVIDSVAALVPKTEIMGSMEDNQMGTQARLMSKALRKLTAVINNAKTSLVFLNQVRQKIGIVYGNPEVTTGGNALKFYASIRMSVSKKTLKTGDEAFGNLTTVKVVKNKLAPPFRSAQFEIIYGEGISAYTEIIDLAVTSEIIEKAGSWYSYNGSRLGQGKEKVKVLLIENQEMFEEIKEKVKVALGFVKAEKVNKSAKTEN